MSEAVGRRFGIRYSRFNAAMFAVLGLPRRWSYVELTGDELVVRMGWAFSVRVALDHVGRAALAERPFIGWGVHGWRGRWLVNGSLEAIVSIEIDPPVRAWVVMVPVRLRTVFVSLADPAGFLHAIEQHRPR